MLTAQRRRTVGTARRKDFAPDGAGGAVWTIPSEFLKSGARRGGKARAPVNPLTPLAWHVVQLAITIGSAGNIWLCAANQTASATDVGGGHMATQGAGLAMAEAGSAVRPP